MNNFDYIGEGKNMVILSDGTNLSTLGKSYFLRNHLINKYKENELNFLFSQRPYVEDDCMYLSNYLQIEMMKATELIFMDEHYINKDIMLSTHIHNINFLVQKVGDNEKYIF